MQIFEFQKRFSPYSIFSLRDIQKLVPDFHRIQLDRWEKKGYLKKIKQGYYSLSDHENDRNFIFYTANRIYAPSYISLEKALKFYGLIPEEIFQITSVSTKKTTNFTTPVGNFSYRHIKPSIFFGYRLMDFGKKRILMADPEKAILDYLYLNPQLKTVDDFREMRINREEFLEQIDLKKLEKYLEAFNKSLALRVNIFFNTVQND
ncbi:MAG: hypothetical protein HZA02_05070 [Nitrospinae bacterium]|nr:hypothetical protein [Nitrospinota bacterium]